MSKNRISATATGLPKLTRRKFVTAAAATPLAALPVEASSGSLDYDLGFTDALQQISSKTIELEAKHDQTPIQLAFTQWHEQNDLTNALRDISDDELYAQVCISDGLAKEIVALPCTCLKDLAAKVLADTGFGYFDLRQPVIDECRALMGLG